MATKYNNLLSIDFTKDNLVALDIYYERIGFFQHYEKKAVPSSSLIADIGGQVGLWLGVSIVSIYEIIELIVVKIFKGFCSICICLGLKKKPIKKEHHRRSSHTKHHAV